VGPYVDHCRPFGIVWAQIYISLKALMRHEQCLLLGDKESFKLRLLHMMLRNIPSWNPDLRAWFFFSISEEGET